MENREHASGARGASRRDFLKKGASVATAAVVGSGLFKTPVYGQNQAPFKGSVLGANDRLVFGFVGVGGQGFNSHLMNVKRYGAEHNAVGGAVAELYSKRREKAGAELGLTAANVHEDYQRLLENKDLDGVFIGTVDHWHAKVAIDAMDAGKHVYCEKPMTRYLDEAFQVHDKVKETGKIFQVGSQFCSEGKWHRAADLIRAGKIGKPVLGQDSYSRNNPDGEWNYEIDPEVSPATLDWDKWLGPVSDREFSADQYHRWRKYQPYCAGILGDLLAHRIHPLVIATGNPEFPRRVVCLGTKAVTPDRDVPDNTQLLAEFPSGLTLLVIGSTVNEQGLNQVIRGHEGTIYFSGNSLELRPERPFADLVDREAFDNIAPDGSIVAHIANFYDSIRNNKAPNGNIDVAIRAQTIISLAEMSERLGEMMFFDEKTRKITNGSGKEFKPITYGTLPIS